MNTIGTAGMNWERFPCCGGDDTERRHDSRCTRGTSLLCTRLPDSGPHPSGFYPCSLPADHCGPCEGAVPVTTKPTNPKDAIGSSKVPFSTVPARVVAETGLALLEGAAKYGRHNYRTAGVRASVYFDATFRHLTAWWEGEDTDPDSGLSHVTKAIASLVVLRDSMMHGNWQDDRPPAVAPGWVADMNARAAAVLARYPSPLPPHTQVSAAHPVRLEPPAADEPTAHYRCGECGARWPVDLQRVCPECNP